MKISEEFIVNFEKMLNQLEKDREELNKKLSKCDKDVNEIYHTIERYNLGLLRAYALYKRLQNLLRERRIIKEELKKIGVIRQHIANKGTEKSILRIKDEIMNVNKKANEWCLNWTDEFNVKQIN